MESGKSNYTVTLQYKGEYADKTSSPIAGQTGQSVPSGEKSNASAKAVVKSLVSYTAYVKPFIEASINQHIQTIALRTGATEHQQRVQFAYDVGKQAVGIVASIGIGFAVGNVAGALTGAVMSITTTAMNYANKARTLQYEQNLEDISLRGMLVRSGGYAPSYGGSRTSRQ